MKRSDVHAFRLDEYVYPPEHPLAGRRGSVFGFAVRTPAGAFLFDTGIGDGRPEQDARFRRVSRDLLAELAACGIAPSDVVAIANSHLHFDHCGRNRRFPGVPIYVQRAEREAARADGYTIPEWVDFPGARFVLVDGEARPLPGIRLVATPGHTAGHQSALVDTDDGIVALAGHDEGIAARLRTLGATSILAGHEST